MAEREEADVLRLYKTAQFVARQGCKIAAYRFPTSHP